MLYVESENPVKRPDTVILARDRNAHPGQVFGRRRTSITRKYPEFQAFWPTTKSVGGLVGVRSIRRGVGVAKFPHFLGSSREPDFRVPCSICQHAVGSRLTAAAIRLA